MSDPEPKNDTVPPTEVTEAAGAPPSGDEEGAATERASLGDPVAEARAEAAKFKDNWVRAAADFDNFRKRSRKEVDDSRKSGKEDLLKDLLPVFDNLDRALQSAKSATEVKALADGLGMILKQFLETLGRTGITKVPTIGIPFDPSIHEAIQQAESDEKPGTVIAEVQPGYIHGERLVRAAMVVVAKAREGADKAD